MCSARNCTGAGASRSSSRTGRAPSRTSARAPARKRRRTAIRSACCRASRSAYNQFLFKKLPFDPAKDFTPITNLFFNFQALVVNANLKVKTVDELVALSKAKAGTLSYTAPSLPLMLYLEKLKRERGADWVSVPFRGGGDTTNAILSGSTPIAFLGLQNFISHLRGGTMNGLAVDGAQRSPLFPDIPTLAELGYRGNLTRVYFALVGPAGTPKTIVDKILRGRRQHRQRSGVPAEADDRACD